MTLVIHEAVLRSPIGEGRFYWWETYPSKGCDSIKHNLIVRSHEADLIKEAGIHGVHKEGVRKNGDVIIVLKPQS